MNKLEEYIQQHRDAFDDRNPDPRIWGRIAQSIPHKPARRLMVWKYAAVAAVGLVLILSGVIAGMSIGQSDFTDTAEFREFQQTENYYKAQYDQKLSALSAYQYDPAIDKDMGELDELYIDLTKELYEGAHPNKEALLEVLIQNYQTRVDMLERVLSRLQEGNQQMQMSEEDETTKI